jgi:hypothetical protein
MTLSRRLAAEFPEVGIGLVGVALAFGLTLLTTGLVDGSAGGTCFRTSSCKCWAQSSQPGSSR